MSIWKQVTISPSEDDRQSLFNEFAADIEGIFPEEVDREMFILSLVEAVNNAAEHAVEGKLEDIFVSYYLQPELAFVVVQDGGEGFSPVFPDIKNISGGRGRGLGLIKANCDAVFFNRTGNEIVLFKGAETLLLTSDHAQATITRLPRGISLIAGLNLDSDRKLTIAHGIGEMFETVKSQKDRTVFMDLSGVNLMTSLGWGTIFSEAEESEVREIVLFNAGAAIRRTADQMGLGPSAKPPYDKISVYDGCSRALAHLADKLGSANVAEAT